MFVNPSVEEVIMRYLNPDYAPQPDSSRVGQDVNCAPESMPDYASMLTIVTTQLKTVQLQLGALQARVTELEAIVQPSERSASTPALLQTHYSPMVKLAFGSIKWVFLFFTGFALVWILATGLRAPNEVIETLQIILQEWFLRIAVLTFAIVATVALLESLKK